ncbi:MAG: aspartate 1-decarboxylase [Acidobacteriota bacterium]
MRRTLLKSKIHRATVTDADLHYVGSMTLDPELMEAADILVHERIEIYNITNGERIATYAIEGERGAGEAILNGAAAHRFSPGDLVIICSYGEVEAAEAEEHQPKVVFVDAHNRVVEKSRAVLASREPLPVPQAV